MVVPPDVASARGYGTLNDIVPADYFLADSEVTKSAVEDLDSQQVILSLYHLLAIKVLWDDPSAQ